MGWVCRWFDIWDATRRSILPLHIWQPTHKPQTGWQPQQEKKTACTGTICTNRIEDCLLKSVKKMGKSKLGNFDYATDVKSGLTGVHWHGNNIIMQHSFKQGGGCTFPKSKALVQSWGKESGDHPTLHDEALQPDNGRCWSDGPQCGQVPHLYTVKEVAVATVCFLCGHQQAWHLCRSTPAVEIKPLDNLAVRRFIARVYLAHATQASFFGRPRGSFPAVNKRVLTEVWYDRIDYII